jgi:hypothetical protein
LDKCWLSEQVACALTVSGPTASGLIGMARELQRRPATMRLLRAGAVSNAHAESVALALQTVDESVATEIEARVLEQAPEQSLATFRSSLRRAMQALAPKPVEERRAERMAERRVVIRPDGDGMSELWALLPAEGAATVKTAIDALAQRVAADDPRSADQRRADALVQLGLDALAGQTCGALPARQRLRPAVQVTVALSTLLELDEQPGELDGHGPIPATLARRIAADQSGTWRRLVTDQTGRLIDYGRTAYRPPKDLAEHVIARDQTCRFPHCNRTARHCEIDHRIAWTDGGHTNEGNLHVLCSRHHHLKHETGWHVERLPDGDTRWTSPSGHRYTQPAATYPTDRTTETDPDPPPPF